MGNEVGVRKKKEINAFLRQAKKNGMTYAQAQYKETAETVKIGSIPAGYRKAGETGNRRK